MKKLILIGGGGHCRSCIDVIESTGLYKIDGIIDMPENIGNEILGYKVIGSDDQIPVLLKKYNYFLISLGQIGFSSRRLEIFNQIKMLGGEFPVIVSSKAHVSKHSFIGEGTIVMHNVIVNANALVGNNCILNTGSLIEHDAIIGDHCHISTHAIINGGGKVNNYSFVGSNAVCIEYKEIPEKSFIKAASVFKGT